MQSETAIAPKRSLFDIEDDYRALIETEEGGIDPQYEAEFREALAHALKTAVDKREAFAQFILGCERRVTALKAEAKRLMDQAATYERAADRARAYGASVIESLGTDAKGKHKKLEGNTVVLSLRAASSRVEFTDESKVPSDYKVLTITVPAKAWEEHIADFLESRGYLPGILRAIERVDVHTSKTAVKQAIENGMQIEGADIKWGEPTLQIR
jgi:hypothetical protein